MYRISEAKGLSRSPETDKAFVAGKPRSPRRLGSRVLRIRYGPHEKSVMHGHPDGVMVCLTDFRGKFTLPDGTAQERNAKAGETMFAAGGQHLPEKVGDAPFEAILVELKS